MIKPLADLHSHTTASDGCLSPIDLVLRAEAQNVTMLAITDHDTTAAVEALASEKYTLRLIPGIEISAQYKTMELHILGLGIDIKNAMLQQLLQAQRERRRQRMQAMCEKLEQKGLSEAWSRLQDWIPGDVMTRTHLARFMVAVKYAKDHRECFERYLGSKGSAYIPGAWMHYDQVVQAIHDAGGKAVIAHPGRYGLSNERLTSLLDDFKQAGGAGMEVVYPQQKPGEASWFAKLCQRFELYASQGSDFHDPALPWIELGRFATMPEGCLCIWETWS